MRDIYTPPPEESDFSEKFILIKQIKEIKTHYDKDEKTQYVPDTETYRMDKDFKFTVDVLLEDDFIPMRPEEELLNYTEENDREFLRLLERIRELKTFENDTTGKISLYLDEVKFKFTEWYRHNDLTRPDSIFYRNNLENLISECIDEVTIGNPAIEYKTDEERKELTDYLFRECDDRLSSHIGDGLKGKILYSKKFDFDDYDFEAAKKRIYEIIYLLKPELKETTDKENKKVEEKITKRLKLSPNEKEVLNSKIVEKVNEFVDMGKGSLDTAYKECSSNSKQFFNYDLTPKQIEGRYKRNKNKSF